MREIPGYEPLPALDMDAVEAACRLIDRARKPLVLVGQGVLLSDARDELKRFAERAGLPFACTLLGLGALPTRHPLYVGLLGSTSSPTRARSPAGTRSSSHLTPGKCLYFSHGFGITYCEQTGIVPPGDVDVVLVAPKGSGLSLRRLFVQGKGLNSSYAISQDATGRALDRVVSLGIGVGSAYLFETDFQREVWSDLTGERGILMGALAGVFEAQFAVLRKNGHSPSEAFNETVEELTQSLMPLVAEKGMDWMYGNCSTTAQRGALDWRHRFRDAVAPLFDELYESVKAGEEARIVIEDCGRDDYCARLQAELGEMADQEIWRAGRRLRQLRP